jgi:hypothetical protein
MNVRGFPALILCAVLAAAHADAQVADGAVAVNNSGPSQNIASTNADSSWRPTQEQRERVEAITTAYFAARDSNAAERAYTYLSPRQKQYLPAAPFKRLLEEFNAQAGGSQGREIRGVTWYKDTPQAGPGLYVAVDYSSRFANLALHCGYLVWQEQADGAFLLVREEANVIDNATMAKLKPEDVQRARSQFRC